jgi:hypothetical protein
MNTRTGEIHDMQDGESMDAFARRIGCLPSDVVPLARRPDGVCKKCNGTGAIRRGLFSKRFKPCPCVL